MKRIALLLGGPIVVAMLAPLILSPLSLGGYVVVLPFAAVIVGLLSVVLGVPVVAVVLTRTKGRLPHVLIAIALTAFVSCAALLFALKPDYLQVGGVVYVDQGAFTAAGWLDLALRAGAMALFSIPGAVLWWLAIRTFSKATPHGA